MFPGMDRDIFAERFLINSRPRPEAAAVEECAKWLIAAKRPLLVVGDEVWKSGACEDLVRFANKFSLPVASGNQAYRNYPARDPMHIGNFAMGTPYVKAGVDLVVMVGATCVPVIERAVMERSWSW